MTTKEQTNQKETKDHLIYSCEKLLALRKEKPVFPSKLKNFLRDLNKKIEKPVKKKKQGIPRHPRKVRQFKRPIRRRMPPYRDPYMRGYNGGPPIPVWHSPSKFARNDEYNRLREKFERERQRQRKTNTQKKRNDLDKAKNQKPKLLKTTKPKSKPKQAQSKPKPKQQQKQRPNLKNKDPKKSSQDKIAKNKIEKKDLRDQIIPLNQQEQEQKQLLFIYQTNEKESPKIPKKLPNKKNEIKDKNKKNNNSNKKGVSIPIKDNDKDSKNEELSLSVEEIKTTSFADFYFDSPSKSYGHTGQYDYVYPNSYVEDNEPYLYNKMPKYTQNVYYPEYDYNRSRPRSRSISNSRPRNLRNNYSSQKKNGNKVKENGKREEKQKTKPIKKDNIEEPKQELLSTSAPLKEPILDQKITQYFESQNNNSENDNSENTKKNKNNKEIKKSPNKLIKQRNKQPEEFFMEEDNSPKFVHSYDPRYDQYFGMQSSSYDNQPNLFFFDQNKNNNKKNNKKNQKNGKNNNNNNSGISIPYDNTFDPNIQNSPDQFAFEESYLDPYFVQEQFYQEELYQQRNYNSSHYRKQYNNYYKNNRNNKEQFSTKNSTKPNNTKNKKNDKLEVEETMNLSRSVPDPIYDEYFQMKN
ncbi:hypothetical protein M0813_19356 [Anaeramoeba flamelloides]|uniref:Uncharacterized protein n=1 Tax=Anaeramoeba flamelloides TaxID=1746091 RepID=A0ABQ8YNQ2_9EUKA|nr:hypothetical protein M0813_19356 [Anaeramoeba flamelloides]